MKLATLLHCRCHCSPRPRSAAPSTDTAVLAGGCFWGMEERVRACEGRHERRLGLRRRKRPRRQLRPGQLREHRPCRGGEDHLRPLTDQLCAAAADLLHRRARSDRGRPAGSRRRSQLSLGHLPPDRRSRRGSRRRSSRGSTAAHIYKAPIATQIESGGFYPAEAYHQGFARKHPTIRTSSSTTPKGCRAAEKIPLSLQSVSS